MKCAVLALAVACSGHRSTPDEITRVDAQIHVVEAFFGERMLRSFEVLIVPTHAELARLALERWKVPELPCFAVAMGTGSTLVLLEPAAWQSEACDHDHDDRASVDRVIAHELVHVFHGQHRPADAELAAADDVGWFVEGLATYASGQLDATRLHQVAALVSAGKAPTRLADAWSGEARYGVSGTLVQLIDRRIGRARLIGLLDASTTADLLGRLGMTEAELLDAWRHAVAK